MKNICYLILLLLLLTNQSVAQAQLNEVPLDKKFTNATVLSFAPPYYTMEVYLEDDPDARYSSINISSSTLLLKRFRKIDKVKPEDKLTPAAIVPGMKVNLYIDHYQRSLKNIAKEVVLSDNYYGSVTITGLFEFLDGKRASVDGQLVILDKDAVVKGQNEWKDKKFTSFSELQLGCELTLHGQRETDGLIYISRGTARPVEENTDDQMLRRAVDLGMKVDRNRLSIGKTFTKVFVTDNTLQDYVNSIGRKLVPQYLRTLPPQHPDHIDFKYYFVEDESMNASAFPNGTVVIHTGLLKNIANEAQLAAIIGHEIAHVTQKHQAKNYRNRKSWKTITDVLSVATTAGVNASSQQTNRANQRSNQMVRTNPTNQGSRTSVNTMGPGGFPIAFLNILSEMYISEYSRSQEMQADRIGLRYMYDAGYDPREAANIWKKLAQDEKGAKRDVEATNMMMQMMDEPTAAKTSSEKSVPPEKRESIYASHPRSRDRFNHISFLLSTAYINADLSQAVVNTEKHERMVGLIKSKATRNRPSTAKGPKP
ncbi:M48 family metalloprotease [Spirosoma sp. HMF4905]|uniref:M48 family metalloprotease n=1 Tax=Spirosoma arboris TaxID=2682092 RepID=A0A7K1SBH2_9BACT|nr:M48 family metallopeptidase [Spirosoma arboris]MVM31121.1 M48 family metalloprotease [Spirosoma arboris]